VLKLHLIINMSGYFGPWVPCRSPADRSRLGIRGGERVSAMKDLGMDNYWKSFRAMDLNAEGFWTSTYGRWAMS